MDDFQRGHARHVAGKIHLNMDVLRCLSPKMLERELRMHFIAYLRIDISACEAHIRDIRDRCQMP
jgi:hypothetical protein